MANQNDKRTASQRIDDLERAVMSLFQVSNNMGRENTMIKDALKLMSNRTTALIQLLAKEVSGSINEAAVDEITRLNQIEELKEKVKNLTEQGFFQVTDTIEDNTFVVGYEAEPDAEDGTAGKVVNPRLQFTLASLSKEIQDQLKGKKVGENVKFKDDALLFKVQEVYKIVNPTPPAAPEAEQTGETPAAPAAEQTAPAAEASAPQSSSDAAPAAAPAANSDQAAGN